MNTNDLVAIFARGQPFTSDRSILLVEQILQGNPQRSDRVHCGSFPIALFVTFSEKGGAVHSLSAWLATNKLNRLAYHMLYKKRGFLAPNTAYGNPLFLKFL